MTDNEVSSDTLPIGQEVKGLVYSFISSEEALLEEHS